jgi:hypothetical protein
MLLGPPPEGDQEIPALEAAAGRPWMRSTSGKPGTGPQALVDAMSKLRDAPR